MLNEPRLVLRDAKRNAWMICHGEAHILTTYRMDEVIPILAQVDQAMRNGYYAAGFVSYEASVACDPALSAHLDPGFPLLWFALYPASGIAWSPQLPETAQGSQPMQPADWHGIPSKKYYAKQLAAIRNLIHEGDIYQTNYTHRLTAAAPKDPWSLFVHMIEAQRPPYGAFINTDEYVVCSASPELFFGLKDDCLESRPMKGTAPRGLSSRDDLILADALCTSAKERAENLMVVDMVRNDLGRIAEVGSVAVPSLFAIEQYPTLWQMTSTVSSKSKATLPEIFQALFPPASITGVPKRRATQIITQLETTPRRLYTGAIGFCQPPCTMQFNVAIRSVLIHKTTNIAEYGVGSGIVWDSRPKNEEEECRTKTLFLWQSNPKFDLLETLLWTPNEGYVLLDGHLSRLLDSARYFGIPLQLNHWKNVLKLAAAKCDEEVLRVRLLVNSKGEAKLQSQPLPPLPSSAIGVATSAIHSQNIFLYHKTTLRNLYQQAIPATFTDALLFNEKGEVTESTIANVVWEENGALFTPPISCGLLPGVAREQWLQDGKLEERILMLHKAKKLRKLYLLNSVRGLWSVTLSV